MQVKTSARIWHGWYSLVRPLITGTRELAANASSLACSKVRIMTMSTIRLITRAVSSTGSARPSWLSVGRQVHDRAAHLVHAGLEADARPRRRLLEDHRQRAVDQRRVLLVVLEALLDDRRALEQVGVFLGAEVPELQVVLA